MKLIKNYLIDMNDDGLVDRFTFNFILFIILFLYNKLKLVWLSIHTTIFSIQIIFKSYHINILLIIIKIILIPE